MNIFEYFYSKKMINLEPIEGEDVFITGDYYGDLEDILTPLYYDQNNERVYFLSKKDYEQYTAIEIKIAEDKDIQEFLHLKDNRLNSIRRPYYRMRGKPVTQDQAFDIIRRTDNFFQYDTDSIANHPDFIGCLNFDNWLIGRNHLPAGYGWIHTDGTVGTNAITQKYPTLHEFIVEWFRKLMTFPYLDLIVAVTKWDETPEYVWDEMSSYIYYYDPSDSKEEAHEKIEKERKRREEIKEYDEKYDNKFYEGILLGIYVHDQKIEFLNPKDTIEIYKEYDKKYGNPREKFDPEFYDKYNIKQVDLAYLKKCIEAYGLNVEEELAKVSPYVLPKE